ncbi:MAG: type II toxin-antitoxin system RelB/DinJ family antitoxin [Bacteroides sp.]|nr:type II toxin-antitoxin system RelB/DinJ family antitoxin [Eubacterium sp.]MCM1417293.1 type II toxin-antitoxin system RelB/DinJ family antitoxin [Roseburia sp.]MCM1461087.1 type II toxin-antitoxin system RelB/DinJ family antitoxin [Bacteroides sp.]
MSQTSISIRMDENLKQEFGELCESIGMTMTTAFCIFAKKSVAEHRIPFDVTSNDPFYSASNMAYLDRVIRSIENGTAKLVEHDLIEVDES